MRVRCLLGATLCVGHSSLKLPWWCGLFLREMTVPVRPEWKFSFLFLKQKCVPETETRARSWWWMGEV